MGSKDGGKEKSSNLTWSKATMAKVGEYPSWCNTGDNLRDGRLKLIWLSLEQARKVQANFVQQAEAMAAQLDSLESEIAKLADSDNKGNE